MTDSSRSDLPFMPGHYRPGQPLLLASSGGADSLGVLHWLCSQCRSLDLGPIQVVSIDHGLHSDSVDWSRLACRQASYHGLDCQVIRVEVPEAGPSTSSLEARAREARYRALAAVLPEDGVLVTAHHARDQAETFLLAALRGSGVAGLAGMPVWQSFGPGWHWRPFLTATPEQLRAQAVQSGLDWVEDPSNADTTFDRNYLRHQLIPVLQQRWPAAVERLQQAVSHQAQTLELIREVAEADWQVCRCEPGPDNVSCLSIDHLLGLSPPRQFNLLRYWFQQTGLRMPPRKRLEVFVQQLASERHNAAELAWDHASLRRYRDRLYLMTGPLPASVRCEQHWPDPLSKPAVLPDGRVVRMIPTEERRRAIAPAWLMAGYRWCIGGRKGGERIRDVPGGPSRDLKHWFQLHGIPPWSRESAVYLRIDDQLVAVNDWGVDAMFRPATGERGYRLLIEWPVALSANRLYD